MKSFLTSLPALLPVVLAWAEKQEVIVTEKGIPLTEERLADARRAGVTKPEKIRVLGVEALPQPEHEDVMFIAKQVGLFGQQAAGLTLGYGICIRQDLLNDRPLLVHECVHVSQYEKMGGLRPFLTLYLRELIEPGYPFGRLEREAILIARDVCREKPL